MVLEMDYGKMIVQGWLRSWTESRARKQGSVITHHPLRSWVVICQLSSLSLSQKGEEQPEISQFLSGINKAGF